MAQTGADYRPMRAQLRQLACFRAVAIPAVAAALFVTCDILDFAIPLALLIGATAFLALIDALTFLRLRHPRPVTEPEIFVQLLVDAAVLSFLLYFTGGATNPFATCYLLLILYAGSALSARWVWAFAAMCIACYAALAGFYVPLPDSDTANLGSMDSALGVIFALLVALVAWFGIRLNEVQRQYGRYLRTEADKESRERYLLGLATLAAGTAHEMSTPLSTMSVVVGDLRHESNPPQNWKESIDMLWQQIQICKRSLAGMAEAADVERLGKLQSVPVRRFLQDLADRFRLLRPEVALKLWRISIDDVRALNIDVTLEQALLNFMNNAADASPDTGVELRAAQNGVMLAIQILDRGPGIAPQLRRRIGKGLITTKSAGSGSGAGVLIANVTVERFGGNVQMFDRKNGGTCVQIKLPTIRASVEGDHDHREIRVAAR